MVITLTSWDIHIYIYDMYDIAPVILAIHIYIDIYIYRYIYRYIYIYSIKSSRTAPIPSMTYVDPQFTLRKKDDVTPCWRSLPLPCGSNGLLLERSHGKVGKVGKMTFLMDRFHPHLRILFDVCGW